MKRSGQDGIFVRHSRWELARVSAAVIRQQMGHASASMTAHYTGEIPVEVVKNFLQLDSNGAAKAA
jgi:hypothetical protein